MALITCPYCNMEISMSSVEAEDGYCPECGAVITASSMFNEKDDDDIEEHEDIDELEDEEFEDDLDFEDEEIEDFDYDVFDDDDDEKE